MPLDADHATDGAQEARRRLAGAFSIDIKFVRPDPAQPRRSLETASLQELADSVSRWGILQPITVRFIQEDGVYQIITGERRFQAAKKAGLNEIPCRVMNPEEPDVLVHQIIENWQRVDLEPFEIADSLTALKAAHGYTQRKLADLTGKSEGEISKLLSLLDLSTPAQELARRNEDGQLSRRHLYAASKLPKEEQRPFLEKAQSENWNAETAEEAVTKSRPDASPSKRGAPVTRMKFTTKEATVQMTFRKKVVSPEMIEAVLDEIRQQLTEQKTEINIVRPK